MTQCSPHQILFNKIPLPHCWR